MTTPDPRAAIRIDRLSASRRDARRFLEVSHNVLGNDPHWVAPLFSDALQVLSPANPFFNHATIDLWVARRGDRDVGRIAGIVDRHHQARHGADTGFFGFFECTDDPEVAGRLFAVVEEWAHERGITRLLGPMNPSANDECGLLVEGFDHDPTLLMPYNPAYYPALFAQAGWAPGKDLLAYRIEVAGMPMARMERIARRYRERNPELVLRPLKKRTFKADLPDILRVYNEAWDDNWGFVPLTEEELGFTAQRLVPLLTEGLVWLAYWGDEPAGVLVTVLDYNQAFKPMRGRWLSRGLLHCLPYLLNWRRPTLARVILLGVRSEFRRRGIETLLLLEGLKVSHGLGLVAAEASWVLEDNEPMNRTISVQGGRVAKKYRIYERRLAPGNPGPRST